MRVYMSKLTPDIVVIYLFHDCERSLPSVARTATIKVQYISNDS